MRTLAALLAVAGALSMEGQVRRRAIGPRPAVPALCEVQGLAGIFRSEDGGQTFSENATTSAADFLFDLEFLEDQPQTVVAVSTRALYDSLDGGCSWTKRYDITRELHHPLYIAPDQNGRAYIYSDEIFLRYDQSSVEQLTPPVPIGTLMVDPARSQHLRMFGLVAGGMFESFDGGASWSSSNRGVNTVVRAGGAHDPTNFDHMLVITPNGVRRSSDGGITWSSVSGLNRTVCEVHFVRHAPNVVWSILTVRAGSATVYRSEDGGSSFQGVAEIPVASDAEGACLPLVVQPFDANRAVVPFRSLYTVDAVTRSATAGACCSVDHSRAAYSKADGNVMLIFALKR